MRIGIAYDTKDMYSVPEIYNNFADEHCIRALQRELEKMVMMLPYLEMPPI